MDQIIYTSGNSQFSEPPEKIIDLGNAPIVVEYTKDCIKFIEPQLKLNEKNNKSEPAGEVVFKGFNPETNQPTDPCFVRKHRVLLQLQGIKYLLRPTEIEWEAPYKPNTRVVKKAPPQAPPPPPPRPAAPIQNQPNALKQANVQSSGQPGVFGPQPNAPVATLPDILEPYMADVIDPNDPNKVNVIKAWVIRKGGQLIFSPPPEAKNGKTEAKPRAARKPRAPRKPKGSTDGKRSPSTRRSNVPKSSDIGHPGDPIL